jgi:hypothetical protein
MSSFPLIPHHLFVSAVKNKRRRRAALKSGEPALSPAAFLYREIAFEVIDFGRPLAEETFAIRAPVRRIVSS